MTVDGETTDGWIHENVSIRIYVSIYYHAIRRVLAGGNEATGKLMDCDNPSPAIRKIPVYKPAKNHHIYVPLHYSQHILGIITSANNQWMLNCVVGCKFGKKHCRIPSEHIFLES